MSSDNVRHLLELKKLALLGGGKKRLTDLKKRGKLSARDRVNLLLDKNSFVETDMLASSRNPSDNSINLGDGVVCGYGLVNGRNTFVFAHDFTVYGGSLAETHAKKICKIMDMAKNNGAPIVGLNDSGGARIQEGILSLGGYADIFFRNVQLSGLVPQISAILGSCAGGAVYSPALTDFLIMKKSASMFITGPKVLKSICGEDLTIDELGGSSLHAKESGVASIIADDDAKVISTIKELLSYLPQNSSELPASSNPIKPHSEYSDIEKFIPNSSKLPYDIKNIIRSIVDKSYFFEVHEMFAKNIVTAFARINGKSVGIVANQPKYCAGAIDSDASRKAAKFVRLCNNFNIPILTLVDVPGFLPGSRQEKSGIITHGAKLLYAYSEATVPKITVILRKAFGGAYCVMASKQLGTDLNYAWPSAEIAVMGAQSAKMILPSSKAQTNSKETGPYQAAQVGYIDDIILPIETRDKIISGFLMLKNKRIKTDSLKLGNIPL